ncbi:MAG TPA: CaiB/BaiF CoA-transferase family protein [Candidatus Binatia bacterium]|nr:CaiB/BaiF CoA-transferase family protein [Candidatus Binatia bacterium]
MSNPLLQGIRILDLSRLLPGPFCSLYLAQLGAEVIKIEEPKGGDYARGLSPELFALVNRGKKSVTLDLRKPEGALAFRQLSAGADAVLESFRPGVMDRLGCGYDALRAQNPRLVYAALTGYGQDGPYRDRAGHDMNYCGYAGALDQIGPAGGPPVLPNTQIADLAGGALTCAIGLLAALLGARASGHGTFVDAAMLDGTLALQVLSQATLRTVGHPIPRGSDMLTGGLPNYSLYECADGRHIGVGALEPKFLQNLCASLGRPDLARLPAAPGAAGEPLRRELAALFRTRTRDEWDTSLAEHDTCVGAVLTPDESLENAQVLARGLVRQAGGKPAVGHPVQFGGAPLPEPSPAPRLGQHTAEVLAAAGCDPAQVERWRTAGIC